MRVEESVSIVIGRSMAKARFVREDFSFEVCGRTDMVRCFL